MALIIEDGSKVSGANSYVTDAEYVAYAAARGKTIGSTQAAREQQLILSMDYIEGHRAQFKGSKVASTQALQWPREGVYIDGFELSSAFIPQELKNAQMEAGILEQTMALLISETVDSNVQSEKLGSLQISYFQQSGKKEVRTDTVDVYLDPLLDGSGSGYSFEVVRS